jgi:hypothetical protein
MTDTTLTPRRLAWRRGHRSRMQSRHLRLRIEGLEERIVPTFFPPTANGIHIFEDQLPTNLSSAMTQFVATHTDGTQKELLSQTDQFRAINPNFTVLHYQLGTGNSPYDYIINDQWASDFNYVNQQESWFAHQSYSGEPQSAADLASGRVGNSTGWDQADIANPSWQQYTLNQVFQNMAATGSNGWFADSYTFGMGGAGYNNPIPTRYQGTNAANPAYWPGGVTWTTQLGNWAQTIENAFSQYNAANNTDYQFIPNLDARVTSWEPNWYDNASGVPFIDGGFLEGFGEYTDTYNWTLSMNRGLNLTDNNKIVIMQPYPSSAPSTAAGQQQIDFFLGTYLLLKGNETYLNIDYGGGVQYYPQYQLNLGTATTPLPSNVSSYLWDGVYRRDFQNGFVLVNPGSTTYTLNLGGNYLEVQGQGGGSMTDADIDSNGNYIGGSLTYQNVSNVTLAGGTAAIFLNPNSGPTVVNPAAAAANPVTGTFVGLSVLGQENGSDSGLTYTWSSSGPAAVTFSANGTNSAKNTTATFTQAGSYTFTANISDGSQSVNSSVTVTVDQTLTSVQVSPATATVPDGLTEQFSATALDQFGAPLGTQPTFTWSIDAGGVGTVSNNGLYEAPAAGVGSANVRAASGTTSGSASISVVPKDTAAFLKDDATTQGTWIGTYGAQGYDVIGDPASLPSYAGITPSGQSSWTWASSTTDTRGLQNPGGSGRIAATWYSSSSFKVDVNLGDGQVHDLELYLVDWDSTSRAETVTISDASSGTVLSTQSVSSFHGGVYLDYAVSGNIVITFTRTAGANAVLSGLFLDPASSPGTATATFLKEDTTTKGTWIGTYGAQGYDVIGDPASLPSYAGIAPSGQSSWTWASSTTDTRGLQNPSGSGRIAATWYSSSSFKVDVSLGDGQVHDLELYLVDWDSTSRAETVTISDASSGTVLSTQSVSSFHGGVYLDYAVSGNIVITFTRTAGANAVLSGLFLDA